MSVQQRARAGGLGALVSLLAWTAAAAAAAVVILAVVVPRLAGATPYTVLSPSMTPTYPVGTLIVVRPVESSSLGVGDVVTYQLRSGEPQTATHRIVTVRQQLDGRREFITQGDANAAADPAPVRPVQIRGTVWYSLPYVGYLHRWISPDQRHSAVVGVGVLLLGYAVVMFVGAARQRAQAGDRR